MMEYHDEEFDEQFYDERRKVSDPRMRGNYITSSSRYSSGRTDTSNQSHRPSTIDLVDRRRQNERDSQNTDEDGRRPSFPTQNRQNEREDSRLFHILKSVDSAIKDINKQLKDNAAKVGEQIKTLNERLDTFENQRKYKRRNTEETVVQEAAQIQSFLLKVDGFNISETETTFVPLLAEIRFL